MYDRALPPDRRCHALGWLLAVFALVSQIALGSMVLPDAADSARAASRIATLDAMSVLCGRAAPHRQERPAPRPVGGALCPPSVALALPGVLPVAAPMLPAPVSVGVWRWRTVAPARGLPARASGAGLPRGPPGLG